MFTPTVWFFIGLAVFLIAFFGFQVWDEKREQRRFDAELQTQSNPGIHS